MENVEKIEMKKASLWKRFVAYLLDMLVVYLPALLLIKFIVTEQLSDDYISIICCIIVICLYLFAIVYYYIRNGFGEGQSWGKKIMQVKVIKIKDMSDCTKGRSAFRGLVERLIFVTIVFLCCLVGISKDYASVVGFLGSSLLECIMVIVTSDGRRLVDRATGTMVINIEEWIPKK